MRLTSGLASAAIAAATLACAASPSQAAVTAYTSQSAFLAAVSAAGTDSFDSLAQGLSDSTYSRSAGAWSYVANVVDASAAPDTFYTVGSGSDTWLSTDTGLDRIVFSGFAANVKGIGAQFFGSNVDGAFLTGQPLLVTFTDTLGTTTQTVVGASTTSFLGFTTTGSLVSMSVQLGSGAAAAAWPTVNNLVLAAAVPEPATWALTAIGIAGLLALTRRSRAG